MWPYYVMILYVFLITGFIHPKIEDKSKWKYLLLIIPLFFFAAIRGNGKGDYFAYINRGTMIRSLFDILYNRQIGMEIGYRIIAYLVYVLRLPRQFTVIFMNLISLSNISVYIKRYSKNKCLSLLLFMPLYFQFDMHAARTAVSISICAIGYKYIQQKNFIKYMACVIAAGMFHSVALISIFAYFMHDKKIRLKNGLIILFFELAIIRFINVNAVLDMLFKISGMDYFSQKLLTYTTSKAEVYGYPMELYDPRIWLGIFVFIAAEMYIHGKNKDERFMINGVFLYAFFIILFSNTSMFAYRLSSYYYIYLIIVIPVIVSKYKRYKGRINYCYINRMRLYYVCLFLFTVLNFAYAKASMVDYIPFFVNGYGLARY